MMEAMIIMHVGNLYKELDTFLTTLLKKEEASFMKITAIIPARGGSKKIPKKNIKMFLGKPLIYYSIQQAKKSQYIQRILVTTDDEEIRKISKMYGAEVPFLRPKEISGDLSTDLEFFQHYLQ